MKDKFLFGQKANSILFEAKPNSGYGVQECDATMLYSSTIARLKVKHQINSSAFLVVTIGQNGSLLLSVSSGKSSSCSSMRRVISPKELSR